MIASDGVRSRKLRWRLFLLLPSCSTLALLTHDYCKYHHQYIKYLLGLGLRVRCAFMSSHSDAKTSSASPALELNSQHVNVGPQDSYAAGCECKLSRHFLNIECGPSLGSISRPRHWYVGWKSATATVSRATCTTRTGGCGHLLVRHHYLKRFFTPIP